MPSTQMLTRHEAVIYVDEQATDSRGDVVMRPSATGITVRCTISPRATSRDRDGSTHPQWSFLAPPDVPLGRWSKVVAHGREFAVVSWPRVVGPAGSMAQHVEAELVEQR